jgi:hypothetical protein
MELYLNTNWTGCYANAYIAEAIACSKNGNHATISTTGSTAEEANGKHLSGRALIFRSLNHEVVLVVGVVGPLQRDLW